MNRIGQPPIQPRVEQNDHPCRLNRFVKRIDSPVIHKESLVIRMDFETFESSLLEVFHLFQPNRAIRVHGRKGQYPVIPDVLEPLMGGFYHPGFGGNATDDGKGYPGLVHGLNQSPQSPVAERRDSGPSLNSSQGFFSRWLRIDVGMEVDDQKISRLGPGEPTPWENDGGTNKTRQVFLSRNACLDRVLFISQAR